MDNNNNNNNLNLPLLTALSIILVILLITPALTQEKNIKNSDLEFLAIQHVKEGSISKINATAYSLELNGTAHETILFSERPDRIVKSVKTSDFIENWSSHLLRPSQIDQNQVGFFEDHNLSIDAPNAVLIAGTNDQDIAIIELFNPVYDYNQDTIKYIAIPDNSTSIELPSKFGQSTLIIDQMCGPWITQEKIDESDQEIFLTRNANSTG